LAENQHPKGKMTVKLSKKGGGGRKKKAPSFDQKGLKMNRGGAQADLLKVKFACKEGSQGGRGGAGGVAMGLGWKGATAARGSKASAARSRIGGLFTFYIFTPAAHMGI